MSGDRKGTALSPALKVVLLVFVVLVVHLLVALVLRPAAQEQEARTRNDVISRGAEGSTIEGPFPGPDPRIVEYFRLSGGKVLAAIRAPRFQREGQLLVRFDRTGQVEAIYGLDAALFGTQEYAFSENRLPDRLEPWMGRSVRDVLLLTVALSDLVRSGGLQ